MFLTFFCIGQLPHRSVNLSFTVASIKNKLTDLFGNRLLQNESQNILCEIKVLLFTTQRKTKDFCRTLVIFALLYPQKLPYLPTLSPTAGPMDDPLASYSRNACQVRCLALGSGCRVQGAGYKVQGSGFRFQGSGFRVQGSQGETPRIEKGVERFRAEKEDLIAASIYDKCSVGLSIRSIFTNCCFTMPKMIQACSNFH